MRDGERWASQTRQTAYEPFLSIQLFVLRPVVGVVGHCSRRHPTLSNRHMYPDRVAASRFHRMLQADRGAGYRVSQFSHFRRR